MADDGVQDTERLGMDEPPSDVAQSAPARPPVAPSEVPPAKEPPPTEAMPAISEIAFEPRPDPIRDPVRVPSPNPSPPISIRPRTLSPRRATTLAAFAEALLPSGGTIALGASEVGTAERLDAALSSWDPRARRTFERTLTWFEWSSVLSRHLLPFSRSKPAARTHYVEHAVRARFAPRRLAAERLKFFVAGQWASTPRVEEALGFTYGCITSDAPVERDRLEVLTAAQITRDHTEECDVVVIGSGAGGAVVAKELAENGMSVVVLEEGAHFTRADFTGPPLERMQRMYRRQGLGVSIGQPGIALPLGMAVGGSTVVSAGTYARAPEPILERWAADGLEGIDAASMRVFFERVERIQGVQPVPEALLGTSARLFRRGAQTLGLHGAPVHRAIDGCRGCGVCSFGCPSDANLSTSLTYLPLAQRHGASIFAGARAERILIEGGRAVGVVARLCDPRTREPRSSLTVRAKVVIVAAGAIHTPALLAANALGDRSGQLGRNLRVQPGATVGGFFDEDVHSWRGTQRPFAIEDLLASHGTMIEVASSPPSIGAGTMPESGARLKDTLARYPNYLSARAFIADTSAGRVVRRGVRDPIVTYVLGKPDAARLMHAIATTADVLLAAGARGVVTGVRGVDVITKRGQIDDLRGRGIRPGALRLAGEHPMGTARMGPDPQSSVVDAWGEVHGVGGLFVADASVLPSALGVWPQLTIMAMATRTADHLARHASKYL